MSEKKVDKKKKPAADKKKAAELEKKVVKKAPAGLINKLKAEQEKLKAEKEEEERKIREEEEKLRLLEEKKAEEERIKKEKKERKKQKEKERKERDKQAGLSEAQQKKLKETRARLGITVVKTSDNPADSGNKKMVYKNKKKNFPKKEVTESEEGKENIIDDDKDESEDMNKAEVLVNNNDSDGNSEESVDDWEMRYEKMEKEGFKEDDKEDEEEDDEEDAPTTSMIQAKMLTKTQEKTRIIQKKKDEEEMDKMNLVQLRISKRHEECEVARDQRKLRAPIVCVLGHVDTGKTSLLDKLRNTDVQGGETGGITQQIGATNVPLESYPSVSVALPHLLLPGLLIIDTPGHESFSNMRSRGSSLCDVAVLVVDLMHGVEEQTKESIKLLRKGRVPFVIALNKVDRLVNWVSKPDQSIKEVIESQSQNTKADFKDRLNQTVAHFATCEINVRCFWEEDEDQDYVSMVPTSAHTGDGMGDLIAYLCKMAQMRMAKKLSFSEELQASVMEVKETPGHGTTLDVILVNGRLRANDIIVVGGQEGPISTKIRYLLKPAPMAELRVKGGEYSKENECVAAQGVKVVAKDLEKAMPGLPVYCAADEDEVSFYKQELTRGLDNILKGIKVADVGLFVQTSTIGSMEALLAFLRQQKVPFAGINIGSIHKKDIMRVAAMKEREPKWAVMLAFNVKVEAEAELHAKINGITIFRQEIIYRLFDDLTQYLENLTQANKDRLKDQVVFPVALQIIPENIFSKRNPILCGVNVKEGTLKMGTPLFVCVDNTVVMIGKAMSLEVNHHSVSEAKTDQAVCVRIDPLQGDTPKLLGRHFKETDIIYSKITRESIDILKEFYRDSMTNDDWKLVVKLKEILKII